MTLYTKLIGILVILSLGFGSGYGIRNYIANKEKLEVQVAQLEEKESIHEEYKTKLEERDATEKLLRNRITLLDWEHAVSLDEQLSENQRLRSDLGVAKRMSVKGAHCTSTPTPVSQSSSSSSLGNASTCELSPATRQLVYDLRAGVIKQYHTIQYLHGYIRSLEHNP